MQTQEVEKMEDRHENSKENKAGSGVHFFGYWYILWNLRTMCRITKGRSG